MAQIAGSGIDLREVYLLFSIIIGITALINIIVFQESEGLIPVIDKRILGYPECKSGITNPLNTNLTVGSACIFPSEQDLVSLSKTLSLNTIPTTEGDNLTVIVNFVSAILSIFSVLILVVKVIFSITFISILIQIVYYLFKFLQVLGFL